MRPVARTSIDTLQIGRALSAIAVVLYHADLTLALGKYLGRSLYPVLRGGDSGVDYFFVLSGFVIVLAHARDFGRDGVVWPFLWKRFRRLVPPLWVVLALSSALVLVVPQERIALDGLPWTVIRDFLVLPWGGPALLPVEWTLRHEVVFYAVFALFLGFPRARMALLVLCLAAIAVGSLYDLPAPLDRLASGYNLLFVFGVGAAIAYRRGVVFHPLLLTLGGAALFGFNWGALVGGLYDKTLMAIWLYGIGAALVVYGAATLERGSDFVLPSPLRLLGDASYAIYLVHYPVVSAMCKLVGRVRDTHPLPDALVFLAVVVPAIAAGVVFHLVVERPLLGWLPTRLGAPPASAAVAAGRP